MSGGTVQVSGLRLFVGWVKGRRGVGKTEDEKWMWAIISVSQGGTNTESEAGDELGKQGKCV